VSIWSYRLLGREPTVISRFWLQHRSRESEVAVQSNGQGFHQKRKFHIVVLLEVSMASERRLGLMQILQCSLGSD
jgi:hypothetical protein